MLGFSAIASLLLQALESIVPPDPEDPLAPLLDDPCFDVDFASPSWPILIVAPTSGTVRKAAWLSSCQRQRVDGVLA